MANTTLNADILKIVTDRGRKIAKTKECFDDFSFDVNVTPEQLRELVPQYLSAFEKASGTKISSLEIDNSGRNYYYDEQTDGVLDYKEQLADFDGRDTYTITITFDF